MKDFLLLAISITLGWDANTEPDIDHYKLKWGFIQGQQDHIINVGKAITHTITESWTVGMTIYFVCTAVNAAGLESDPSNEVFYTIAPWNPNAPGHLKIESITK